MIILTRRRLLHLQTVLVGPGQQVHLVTQRPPVPRQRVRQNRCVRMPQVRLVVHVVDGRGNVEAGHGEKYGMIAGKSAICGRRGDSA